MQQQQTWPSPAEQLRARRQSRRPWSKLAEAALRNLGSMGAMLLDELLEMLPRLQEPEQMQQHFQELSGVMKLQRSMESFFPAGPAVEERLEMDAHGPLLSSVFRGMDLVKTLICVGWMGRQDEAEAHQIC